MGLNKQKGNMYGFVTHTWNAIKGRCSHDCSYCYMRNFWKSDIRLDEKELETDLGEGNFIFVGSSTDIFAKNIPERWIMMVLEHCRKFSKNIYLFQSKNPRRFKEFFKYFPPNIIFGTTIETNLEINLDNAPPRCDRIFHMLFIPRKFKTMITIEPIMDFDLTYMVSIIRDTNPSFVNIGADSKGHNLPEPSPEKIKQLINELEKFTKVNLKDNLNRLLK